VALLAHSYGDQLVRYFLNWVEAPEAEGGGGGGKWWTDRHVATYVDIAGPMLGGAVQVECS
jgi:phospholipid:diacylglycerol acyltransferase